MKKIISIMLIIIITFSFSVLSFAESKGKSRADIDSFYANADIDISGRAKAVYLCEATTGKVLYAENEFDSASPASVTKIMTLLLVCEAIDAGRFSLTDTVRVSARAASMGGSQVFLEEGEKISVEELLKSAVIASGNDASVALAELTAGSEAAFVKMMNARAAELGLKNTSFENATGLDDTTVDHYSCPADIAAMSRELIKHSYILDYSSTWQDSIRNGEFTLTNTNRLVRYYDGCNGLKTGSTDKAGYCISATAKRGNMQLIAVVMGAESRDVRNEIARELLDYGFANYALYERAEQFVESVPVVRGVYDSAQLYSARFSIVIDKAKISKIEMIYDIPERLEAPISKGSEVGSIIYKVDGEQIGTSPIYVNDSVEKISMRVVFSRILQRIICG
ncbi:MAG: D-alanyl-D-alanine carboxypeptidase [Clostridia bacterium]|nr:D-alanyl-D-alanine carboxypeptidase [Clostridia bacterium]